MITDKKEFLERLKSDDISTLINTTLEYASEDLRGDKEVVFKAVEKHGSSLKYASDALKDDKEVVLKAVEKYGSSLEFASERLQKNPEIVFAAVASGYKLKTKKEIEKKLLYKLWGLSIVLFSMYLLSTESFSNFKDFFKFLIISVFAASTFVSSFISIFWRIYFNERIHPSIALLPSFFILGFVLGILPFSDDNLIQFLGNFNIPYVISKLLIILPIIYIFFKLMMWLAKEKKWKRLLVQIIP
jgi:hypothetical protein